MFIKREGKDDCIIAGYVISDAKEKQYEDKFYTEFAISMGKDEKGENLPLVNISVWERDCPTIFKGDRVLACGKLKANKSTKDDKIYYSLTADFCIKEGISKVDTKKQSDHPELTEVDDDSLPF